MMKLYFHRYSSASRRVRIALALKQIAHEAIDVDLSAAVHRSEAYPSTHPQGLVPALVTDDGLVLTQSQAIVTWLAARFGGLALFGDNPREAAAILEIVNVVGCDVHALQGQRLLRWLEEAGAPYDAFASIARRAIH